MPFIFKICSVPGKQKSLLYYIKNAVNEGTLQYMATLFCMSRLKFAKRSC